MGKTLARNRSFVMRWALPTIGLITLSACTATDISATPYEKAEAATIIATYSPPLPETWEWREAPFDDGTLRWGIATAEEPKGTLLFLPGFSQFIELEADLLTKWHAAGYTVVALDLPGQGQSDGRQDYPTLPWSGDMSAYGDVIAAFAAGNLADLPRPFIPIAYSFAGNAVLHAITEETLTADAVVLMMPAFRVRTGPWPEFPAFPFLAVADGLGFGEALVPTSQEFRLDTELFSATPVCRFRPDRSYLTNAYFLTRPEYQVSPPTIAWVNGLERSGYSFANTSALEEVSVPILTLIAGKDALIDNSRTRTICSSKLSNCTLIEFSEAGHCTYTEPDSHIQIVADRVIRFADTLTQQDTASAESAPETNQ
ncbi:lysophospholipase L2, putative [Parvularcula bermudensis HTCC2503]|uniref:Lysophospholipase L2, putative n=1 Tax=Parvularcula bermudensis (strain ATCC BAA-594 / HTCC2503 / KCTC 12087) TaxID=314260 RepID=E0TI39_PARBH|nr:alpha/beta hydrolase [Parvularcula bermudensis]ADM09378.1 lysophospholipase L2, putative [Parvularcula bermudensis HTCC2503]